MFAEFAGAHLGEVEDVVDEECQNLRTFGTHIIGLHELLENALQFLFHLRLCFYFVVVNNLVYLFVENILSKILVLNRVYGIPQFVRYHGINHCK